MIRSDNHIHTNFSSDSSTPAEDMVKKGLELGLSSLCFTDHIDYGFPKQQYGINFLFSPEDYFAELDRLSLQYRNISLRKGVELGLKADILSDAVLLAQSYPFDFIIGSTHLVDNIDPYYPEYWEAYGEGNGIRRYYEVTYENLKHDFDFDVYGHIDYVVRYCPTIQRAKAAGRFNETYYQKSIDANWELICAILEKLICTGRGIEINTGGFKANLNHPNPHERILKQYYILGGRIVTVGSDAHSLEYLGFAFDRIPSILKKCGFSSYTEFKNRKPYQVPIE